MLKDCNIILILLTLKKITKEKINYYPIIVIENIFFTLLIFDQDLFIRV